MYIRYGQNGQCVLPRVGVLWDREYDIAMAVMALIDKYNNAIIYSHVEMNGQIDPLVIRPVGRGGRSGEGIALIAIHLR